MSATFASNPGARHECSAQFIEALNGVGLPGMEISSFVDRVYSVTGAQLRMLGLGIPNR
jgi:hypothetical protein